MHVRRSIVVYMSYASVYVVLWYGVYLCLYFVVYGAVVLVGGEVLFDLCMRC